MRLLILTPEFGGSGGGIMTFYRALVPALRDAGVTIRVIEGSAGWSSEDRATRVQDGVQVELLERSRVARWIDRFPDYAAAPGLRRHLAAAWAMWEQADYGATADIIEAADWGLLFVPPAVEALRPLVVQCHGSIGQIADHDPIAGEATENLLARLIESCVLSAAEAVQAYSHANAKFWRTQTSRDVTTILPAWSAPSEIEPQEPGSRGLVVGRLQRWKGPVVLCEALRRLGSRAPCVDWIGRDTAWSARDGSTAATIAQSYSDLWLTKFIHGPQVSPVEVARCQARALFNLVPSTWDTFNFTTVEAMASGRPAIVSTGAGASELIEHNVNGYLFANENAEALASVIDRVLNESPAHLAKIGREGQRTVHAELDPRKIAEKRIANYQALIDRFKENSPARIEGWLNAVCKPVTPRKSDMSFLENFPLRALIKHVGGRIVRRFGKQ